MPICSVSISAQGQHPLICKICIHSADPFALIHSRASVRQYQTWGICFWCCDLTMLQTGYKEFLHLCSWRGLRRCWP